jgi:uncharacterized protein (DUF433 family)
MHHMGERTSTGRAVRETTSFRLRAETLGRLDARARLLGTTRTRVAEQLLEEGLRLVEHPGIVFRDGPAGRRAGVAGSGLDVWEVVEAVRANRGSLEAAAAYLDVPTQRVEVAARYYAAHPGEIDEWIRANDDLFEREAHLAAERERLLS